MSIAQIILFAFFIVSFFGMAWCSILLMSTFSRMVTAVNQVVEEQNRIETSGLQGMQGPKVSALYRRLYPKGKLLRPYVLSYVGLVGFFVAAAGCLILFAKMR